MKIFKPKPTLSKDEIHKGLRTMTIEGMVSIGYTSITTSGLLAAFALVLGANNLQIGILAAIPFLMQPLQVPAILLVEKLRRRKAIAVTAWLIAQLLWFPIALIPVFMEVPGAGAISVLLGLMAIRSIFSAVTNCSWNSWMRDLVPQQILGRIYSRRLALSSAVAALFGLGAAFFVDYWSGQVAEGSAALGYTYVLLFGAVFLGLASPLLMSRLPEHQMPQPLENQPSLWQRVIMPLRDTNFRQLMQFLFFWSFALNMAVPFFVVYMLQRLELPLTVVIGLGVLSQFFNILFLRVWGPLVDRFGSKAVLSVCASLYLLVILGWTFTTMPERYIMTIPLLVMLHIFAGIAIAGVTLTVGTIGFKLAPRERSASYIAGSSLATNLGTGLGPLAGGLLAHFFSVRMLSLDFTWIDPGYTFNLEVINLSGLDFLFMLAFIIGLITLNMLSSVREDGEAGREEVLGELRARARSSLKAVNSLPGLTFLDMFPVSFLSKVPGVDVALGVTTYQMADTAKTLTVAALKSGITTVKIARALQKGLSRFWTNSGIAAHSDVEIARQSARGVLHATDETPAEIEQLAGPAVVGIVRALNKAGASPYEALRGAAYGVVEGAGETGMDLEIAVAEIVLGAREIARELKLTEDEAVQQAARGAIEAAEKLGANAVDSINYVLRSDLNDEQSIYGTEKDVDNKYQQPD